MKKFIKLILRRIYEAGYFEYRKKQAANDILEKAKYASFDDSVVLKEAVIENNRKDAAYIQVGSNSVIRGELMLFKHSGNIRIGKDCFIGPGSKIWSAKNIQIGNRVLIAHNVNIHDNISHPLDAALRHEDFLHIFYKGGLQENIDLREADVIIGDDVWIGFNAIILKGVTIGNGAIIGAGSIITKDVPAFAVIAGNPQRIVKYTT